MSAKKIRVSMGKTVNTGNYESFRINYEVEFEGDYGDKEYLKELTVRSKELYKKLNQDVIYFIEKELEK